MADGPCKSPDDYGAKAQQMEREAFRQTGQFREHYLELARQWRDLEAEARWAAQRQSRLGS